MIQFETLIKEIEYEGNLGFYELFTFYNIATDQQVEELEELIAQDKLKEAWKYVQRVTGMSLKGDSFN